MSDLYGCTCGPYSSIIPPEPCPIHQPEQAYWRMKLLREFGGEVYRAPTTSASLDTKDFEKEIPKYQTPVVEKHDVHFRMIAGGAGMEMNLCGASNDEPWAKVLRWVSCKDCLSMMRTVNDDTGI